MPKENIIEERVIGILLRYLYPQKNRVIGFKAANEQSNITHKLCEKFALEIANKIIPTIRHQALEEALECAPKYRSKVIPLFSDGFDEAVSIFKKNIEHKKYEL